MQRRVAVPTRRIGINISAGEQDFAAFDADAVFAVARVQKRGLAIDVAGADIRGSREDELAEADILRKPDGVAERSAAHEVMDVEVGAPVYQCGGGVEVAAEDSPVEGPFAGAVCGVDVGGGEAEVFV